MNRIWGIVTLILALGLVLAPVYTSCPTSKMIMTCHWTGQAESAVAIPLFLIGFLFLFSRFKDYAQPLSLIGIALGISAILLPTVLIGTCETPMKCATVMKPVLVLLGALLIVGNLGVLFYSLRKSRYAGDGSVSSSTT